MSVPDVTEQELNRAERRRRRQQAFKVQELEQPEPRPEDEIVIPAEQDVREITRLRQPGTVGLSTETFTPPPLPSERTPVLFEERIQSLYEGGNFPSQEEVREAFLEAGPAQIDSVSFPPENIGEALHRISYGIAETLGGGIREATLGLSGSLGVEERPGGEVFQVTGALLTPTLADLGVNFFLQKLAPVERGRTILRKLAGSEPTPMWASRQIEAIGNLNFERIAGKDQISTRDLRTIQRKLGELDTVGLLEDLRRQQGRIQDFTTQDFRILEQIKNADDISTFDRRTAKRAVTNFNSLVQDILETDVLNAGEKKFLETIIGSTGQTTDDIRNALSRQANLDEKLRIITEFYEASPTEARVVEVIEEIVDFDNPYEIREVINFIEENEAFLQGGEFIAAVLSNLSDEDARELLGTITDIPTDELDDTVERLREGPTIPEFEKDLFDDTIVEPDQEEEPEPQAPPIDEPIEEPPIEEPLQEPDEEEIPIDEPIQEEEIVPPAPPIDFEEDPVQDPDPVRTRGPRLTRRIRSEKREINLRLFNGPKEVYRVTFQTGRKRQVFDDIEARSIPGALVIAQRRRKTTKRMPSIITVTRREQ